MMKIFKGSIRQSNSIVIMHGEDEIDAIQNYMKMIYGVTIFGISQPYANDESSNTYTISHSGREIEYYNYERKTKKIFYDYITVYGEIKNLMKDEKKSYSELTDHNQIN